jgi:hypothetical protein
MLKGKAIRFYKFILKHKLLAFIAGAAALVPTTFLVYDRYTDRLNITAYGDYSSVQADHPQFQPTQYFTYDEIKDYLPHNCGLSYWESQNLVQLLNQKRTDVTPIELPSLVAFWQFTITNDGSRQVEGLAMEVPFSGYYQIYRAGEIAKASRIHEKKIDIGNLPPTATVRISVWSDQAIDETGHYFNLPGPEDIKLYAPAASFTITYPTKATGFSAIVARYWILFLLVEMMVLMFIFVWYDGKRSVTVADQQGEGFSTQNSIRPGQNKR